MKQLRLRFASIFIVSYVLSMVAADGLAQADYQNNRKNSQGIKF